MAKILVCETREYTGRSLIQECEKDDHEARLLAKENNVNYVLENISQVVEEFRPDYLIIDHLGYRCFEAIDLAKKVRPGLAPILHTTHLELFGEAEKRNIPFYEKHNCQVLDNMFMDILLHERGRYFF